MRIIFKILAAPFVLVLTLLVAVLSFLLSLSAGLLSILASVLGLLSVLMLFVEKDISTIITFTTIPPPMTAPGSSETSSAPRSPCGGCLTGYVWSTICL